MAANPSTALMTVEEFRKLPEPQDGTYFELHHGELVHMTQPRHIHNRVRRNLFRLLVAAQRRTGVTDVEVVFRAEREFELRCADVAFVSQTRYDATPDDDNLAGSPELVIEVVSPSNRPGELKEKELLC